MGPPPFRHKGTKRLLSGCIRFKRRAKAASARYFPQRGFIPVSDKIIYCEHEKPAKMGCVKSFGWEVGCRGTERFQSEAFSGTAEGAERPEPSSQRKRHATASFQAGTNARGTEWRRDGRGDHGVERAMVPAVPVLKSAKSFSSDALVSTWADITKFQPPQLPRIRSKRQNNWHSKTSRPWRCRAAF